MKIAVQEIVSDQLLGHKSLQQEDHGVIQYVIKILTQKNEDARVKNKKSGGPIAAQGVYFSILPSNAVRLENSIMQGAIHDKSRMKSRRQSLRPHPIFGLDIAIAYAFRVVLEREFARVGERDFPRCPANGFANAASFEPPKSKGVKGRDSVDLEPPHDEYLRTLSSGIVAVADVAEYDGNAESHGVVKFFFPSGYGFVSVNDGGPDAYIRKREMVAAVSKGVEIGTAVKFKLSTNYRGRVALDLEVSESSEKLLTDAMKAKISDFIFEKFESGNILDLGELSVAIRNHFGDTVAGTSWLGFGKFSWLIQALELPSVEVDTSEPPGRLIRN